MTTASCSHFSPKPPTQWFINKLGPSGDLSSTFLLLIPFILFFSFQRVFLLISVCVPSRLLASLTICDFPCPEGAGWCHSYSAERGWNSRFQKSGGRVALRQLMEDEAMHMKFCQRSISLPRIAFFTASANPGRGRVGQVVSSLSSNTGYRGKNSNLDSLIHLEASLTTTQPSP